MLPVSRSAPVDREFRIDHGCEGETTTITPVGELDGASAIDFEEALSDVIAAGRPIVIDLRRLTFIDSSGLWAITLVHKTCKRRGISLCLLPGPEHVQNVFEITGLFDLLPFVAQDV